MTRGADLAAVRANGKRTRGAALELRTTTTTPHRVGIIVPRHSHTAVDRNRIKRRLREIIRTERLLSTVGRTMVVFALPSAYRASYDSLREELSALCRRATS